VIELLHSRFEVMLILYMLVLGVWGVANFVRGAGVSGGIAAR
jgi:hypothetical protein